MLLKNNKPKTLKSTSSFPVVLEPFASTHRLCNYFPYVEFRIGGSTFLSRLSFSFPFVKPPNMIPNVDETLISSELGYNKEGIQQHLPSP